MMLKFGRGRLNVGERNHLAAGSQSLREARNHRVGVRSNGGIVLKIVFHRNNIGGSPVPVKVRHQLVRGEDCRPRNVSIIGNDRRRDIPIIRGDHVLAIGQFVLQHCQRHGIDLARRYWCEPVRNNEVGVGDLCQSGRRAVAIGESKRNGEPRNADFTVAIVEVLIANIAEEFVFDQRSAERAAQKFHDAAPAPFGPEAR